MLAQKRKGQITAQVKKDKLAKPEEKLMINVHTGKYNAFVDQANVSMILHDKHGNSSQEITAFLDPLKGSSLHAVVVSEEQRGNIERGAAITKVELRPGFATKCYVKRIEVQNNETDTNFGVFRMVELGTTYYVTNHTSLPQNDDASTQKERKEVLQRKREEYKFTELQDGLPAEVEKSPSEEQFTTSYEAEIVVVYGEAAVAKMWDNLWNIGTLKTTKDLEQLYSRLSIFNRPEVLDRWNFDDDTENDYLFGNQRTNGLNPSIIRLCRDHADLIKIPVTDEMLKKSLEGKTIKEAIDEKRLFICDLEILRDVPVQKDFVLCAPVGLFFVDKDGILMPVAIQLFQKPANDNPVFLPTDGWNWTLAKMWFNNADAAYHQSITHLGFTHLLMEGVVVATHRQLSRFHPIFKMLAPHFLFLIAINYKARGFLISKDGIVDKIMNAGVDGTFEIIRRRLKTWRMDVDGTLPEELKQRGVEDTDTLPNYHFRDDALRVYEAIKTYVTAYVKLYYENTEDLRGDWEIQAWAKELTKERDNEKGGCGLQGVPGHGQLDSVDDLITILTSIIYTCSVGHASANFAQYDEYGFPPNYPGLLRGQPPKDKKTRSENDIVKALADVESILYTMQTTKLLSTKDTRSLGDFEEVPTITDENALKEVKLFRSQLAKVSKDIQKDNKDRPIPYTHVDPENVPNAISI